MTIIEASATLRQPISTVYLFLEDLTNHEQLMPSTIYNWSATHDEARFTIQNMAKLAVKVVSRSPEGIVLQPVEAAPFPVTLRWTLVDHGDGTTTATHTIEAELNMMMKMLAAGPLQKLVDFEVGRLKEILVS